ncbi:MAG: GFA family protein [Blastomonas sp.]
MSESGGCHCGAVRYEVTGEPGHHALCHCTDCRRSSGAPAVSWAMFAQDQISISGGDLIDYASSENAIRQFCAKCGTGLFYINETVFPGLVDIQSATLDNPDAFPLGAQIQTAERIGWMEHLDRVPAFERYPGPE